MPSDLRDSEDAALRSIAVDAKCDPATLFERVYDELRRIAARYLGRERANHTLQPTALVHDAYLRLMKAKGLSAENELHFRALAARVMRQLLIEHARAKATSKRGGDRNRVTLMTDLTPVPHGGVDLLELEEAMTKVQQLDPRLVRVVELRFYGGLTIDEVAVELEVSPTVVKDDWRVARALLAELLERDQ